MAIATATEMQLQFTAIIERDGSVFTALCPELDIASQGASIEEARDNLKEALELYFEVATESEARARLRSEVYITKVEVNVGRKYDVAPVDRRRSTLDVPGVGLNLEPDELASVMREIRERGS